MAPAIGIAGAGAAEDGSSSAASSRPISLSLRLSASTCKLPKQSKLELESGIDAMFLTILEKHRINPVLKLEMELA